MKKIIQRNIITVLVLLLPMVGYAQETRSIDGTNNNLQHPSWGAAEVNQLHFGTIGFSDGVSEPAGPERPNPRHISNMLFGQNTLANDPRGLSAYCWVWGQFIDHDITLVKDNEVESMAIPIPGGDVFFDPEGTGTATMTMLRSAYDPLSGTDIGNPRQFINSITAYIDASTVYGSEAPRAGWLRTFADGKLKVSSGNLLPWNTTNGEFDGPIDPQAPEMAMPFPFITRWFVAGDLRANENPFLTSMHTLFVREHNRLCDILKAEHPEWGDEQLYQHARRLVGGQMQAIVYEEWLPTMGIQLETYAGYDRFVNPGILNVFSAAAYRYGHTTINSVLVRMDNQGNYLPEGDLLLRDAFFNPGATVITGGIEPFIIGMATVVQQDFDCKLVDDLRNFLFGQPGAGGLDLAAINIARGRERGLSDYNTVRTDFGLEAITSFDDMSADLLMNQTLAFTYGEIDNIDPWVGMLAENHMPDALFGHTAMTIIKQQFKALRDGDRFYYANDPAISADEKSWIKATRLADVIRRNTPVTIIKDEIFKVQALISATEEHKDQNSIDFALYPNPVERMVFLRIPSERRQESRIRIIDLQGKILIERDLYLSGGNNTMTLTLPHDVIPGLYVMTLDAETGHGSKQFVKK